MFAKYKRCTLWVRACMPLCVGVCVCLSVCRNVCVFLPSFRGTGHHILSVYFLEHVVKRNSVKYPLLVSLLALYF